MPVRVALKLREQWPFKAKFAPSLSYVMKFSDITRTDVCYLLRGIKAKNDVTTAGMVMEATAPYGKSQTKLSKKGQKICDEMMKKLKEVLEENNI